MAFGTGAAASGQQGPDTDWAVTTGNNASQRYAPLDQIDRENFAELEVAWRWSSPDNELMTGDGGQGARPTTPRNHEAIPIKVGDRLYVTTGYGQIAAVDIEQGTSLWTYDPQANVHGRPTSHHLPPSRPAEPGVRARRTRSAVRAHRLPAAGLTRAGGLAPPADRPHPGHRRYEARGAAR